MIETIQVVHLDYVERCLFRMRSNNTLMTLKEGVKKARKDFAKLSPFMQSMVVASIVIVVALLIVVLWCMYKLDTDRRAMVGYTWIIILVLGVLVYFVF